MTGEISWAANRCQGKLCQHDAKEVGYWSWAATEEPWRGTTWAGSVYFNSPLGDTDHGWSIQTAQWRSRLLWDLSIIRTEHGAGEEPVLKTLLLRKNTSGVRSGEDDHIKAPSETNAPLSVPPTAAPLATLGLPEFKPPSPWIISTPDSMGFETHLDVGSMGFFVTVSPTKPVSGPLTR